MLNWLKKWSSLISLILTIFFGLKGWITMESLINLWNNLNPWKTLSVTCFILFLISFMVDYFKMRKMVYQLFSEHLSGKLGQEIHRAVKSGLNEGFHRITKKIFPKTDENK